MFIEGRFKRIKCLRQIPNVIESSFKTASKVKKASSVPKGVFSVASMR